jgi:hypothetical protein
MCTVLHVTVAVLHWQNNLYTHSLIHLHGIVLNYLEQGHLYFPPPTVDIQNEVLLAIERRCVILHTDPTIFH